MSQKRLPKRRLRFFKNKLTIFCQKTQNFVYFLPCDIVQISPECGSNTYQIMYWETLNFQCQSQWWQYKMNDRKTNFCNKFAIKTLLCYRCKYCHQKSKVSPYIIWYVFELHADKIWGKSHGPKCTKYGAFWQETEFLKTIFDKCWHHFLGRSCT